MSINTIETANKYTGELDKIMVQKAATGFFADNLFSAKFVGAKTVLIPDIDFVGLADYDRDDGFSKSGMTVAHTSYTLSKDRARKLMIDREDMDESGIANLAGQILGEYIRTKVVPEMDAYALSKLYKVAADNAHTSVYNEDTAIADMVKIINSVQDKAGYDQELVAFVDGAMYSALMTSAEFSKQLIVSDFKQGEVNLKVKSLNGVAIIPVSSDRMKSEYVFDAGTTASTGGFAPADGAEDIRAIIIPKKAASLVKKTETLRIFTPAQNKDADAYEFNYRLYYDLFVKKSNIGTVYAIAG